MNPNTQAIAAVNAHGPTTASVSVAAERLLAPLEQPIRMYPQTSLKLLKLKCPAIRDFCETRDIGPVAVNALNTGLGSTLACFGENLETSQASFESIRPSNSETRATETRIYTCAQARLDGSALCPANGCPLPGGTIATLPTDLLTWDCNLRQVGHAAIASSIVASEFSERMIWNRDRLLVYREGAYETIDDQILTKTIFNHLGDRAHLKNAIDIAKVVRIQNAGQLHTTRPSVNHICFTNGTYSLVSGELGAHSPSHMLRNRIHHAFDPNATCDRFLAFLRRIWRDDNDIEAKIQLLQQWFGYLLVADTSMQKMLVLWGKGANGKSILMDIVTALIGPHNIATAMLDRLKMPYVRATMEGRLLNQSADLPKLGVVADGDMKALITGDPIEVSPKYEPSYTVTPYARFMAATNNLPNTKDDSDGYFRRLIILCFNRQFTEQEREPHLLEQLVREMPGIVAWAVQGLLNLREQGHFTIPASSAEAVEHYQHAISPERMFAEECLQASTDRSGYSAKVLFNAFRNWCRDHGLSAGNVVTFGRSLASLGFDQRKSGNTVWMVAAKGAAAEYFGPGTITDPTASS